MDNDFKPSQDPLNKLVTPTDPSAPGAEPTPPTEVANTPPSGPTPTTAAPPPKTNRSRWLILAIVILLAAGGAVYALSQVNKPQKTANTEATKKSVALLRFGVTQPFPTDFYPKVPSDILPLEVNNQIFEGLTQYQNGNQVIPDLAQSWTNPDSTTWVFKLLPNLKFHNGSSLAAAQVKSSLDALQSSDYGKAYGGTIKSVEAVDSATVKIVTTVPDPLLPSELTNLWIYDTASTTPNDPANGTGPYTIKPGTKLTADTLQLVANDEYHGDKPLVRELDFKYYPDTKSQVADMKLNKLEVADLSTQAAVNEVASLGYKAYPAKSIQVYFITPNTLRQGSPLQNLKVRKAIYEAIDVEALEKADGRTGTLATQLVPQQIPGYNSAIKRPALNPTQAKTDLASAGYPNGFTVMFTYFASHQALAEELQKQMAAIGVKLTLDPQTVGSALGKKAFGGQTDLFYFGYSSTLVDSSDVFQQLSVDTANYKNAQIDSLFNQASTTFTPAARLNLLQQINQVAMDDVNVMPLYTPDSAYFAVKNDLVINTDNLANYSGIDFWKVYSQK